MARAAGLSRAHFSRQFRRAFGESPHGYLLTRRLERAASLLRYTDRSVADICMSVGLQSVGSFTSSFTRHFGKTTDGVPRGVPAGVGLGGRPGLHLRAYGRPPAPRLDEHDLEKTAPTALISSVVPTNFAQEDDMIKIANAQVWVHDQDVALEFYTKQARHGGAAGRHRARARRLPLAHRRAARTGRGIDRADGDPRPADVRRRDRRADPRTDVQGLRRHGVSHHRRLRRVLRRTEGARRRIHRRA